MPVQPGLAPRRFARVAALCGTVVVASAVVDGFSLPDFKNTDAVPVEDRLAPPLSGDAGVSMDNARTAAATVTGTEGWGGSEPVEAALPGLSQMLPPETPRVQIATLSTAVPVQPEAKEAVNSTETGDECLVPEICIDQYLWSVYQRTPKLDTINVVEHRKTIVKKSGKLRAVLKNFTKLVHENFTWKDPMAAAKAGMSLMDYVIGGMDRSFKLKLYHALRAMDDAGLSPGITSAFRDDHRQSLASGLKAATDRSYHGGSFRGGYGHGLAADIVSVKGENGDQRWIASEKLWNWIDQHGKEFGIGRPYLDKDPPHVAPIDGKEYADHRRGANARHAAQ